MDEQSAANPPRPPVPMLVATVQTSIVGASGREIQIEALAEILTGADIASSMLTPDSEEWWRALARAEATAAYDDGWRKVDMGPAVERLARWAYDETVRARRRGYPPGVKFRTFDELPDLSRDELRADATRLLRVAHDLDAP